VDGIFLFDNGEDRQGQLAVPPRLEMDDCILLLWFLALLIGKPLDLSEAVSLQKVSVVHGNMESAHLALASVLVA
jgi:hypothetical protein